MNHVLAAVLLAAFTLSFQDPPAPAAPPKGDEAARDVLKKGLEASAAAGGFTFSGSLDQESPFAGVGMGVGGPMMSVGPTGKCSGTLGADGIAHVRIEKDKNVYEVFRKGSKVVHRQVWKGTQISSGTFADEAGAALDLAKLAKAAGKSKDAKREAETKKVGDVECVVIKTGLSADLVDTEAPEGAAPGGFEFKMFELKRIEATFYLGQDDNLLRKAEFKFIKGFNAMIAGAMPGGGGDDDEDDEEEDGGGMGGVKKSFASKFTITLGAFSKTQAVTIPDDVKAGLGD